MFSKKFTKKISFALCLSLLAGSVFSMNTFAARKKTTLAKKSLKLTVGEKQTIKLKNKNKKAKYTFVSSKKKVATVSKNGIVSAKKKGVANIKVTEIIKKKKRTLGSVKISVSDKQNTKETAVPSNQATSQPTNAPANNQTGTPQTTLEPTATPVSDPYTKKLFEVDYKITDKEVVEGSTCKVTMDFFNADITSEYMSEAKTYKEASIVKKEYKKWNNYSMCKVYYCSKRFKWKKLQSFRSRRNEIC